MEDVAGEDRRACFLAEVPDVGAADLDGRRVVFHEDGLRRAARQGLEAECAGAGEGVEHARLRQAAVSLGAEPAAHQDIEKRLPRAVGGRPHGEVVGCLEAAASMTAGDDSHGSGGRWPLWLALWWGASGWRAFRRRSEEHTSELQSLMRSSYAVFCLKKK